jgi:hypothetical protein
MKGSIFPIITFIVLTASREEKEELPLQIEKAFPTTDADIIDLLSFRRKSILAGDLNSKNPSWNSIVSSPSGLKLLNLLHISEFEISVPQCLTHNSPTGTDDVPDMVVHENIRLSEFIFTRTSDYQKSFYLTFWTQITYQLFSSCWIT